MIFVVMLVAWSLFRMLNREATIEEARTIGLQKASQHIHHPILLEDYIAAKRIPKEEMVSLIEQGEIPAYSWRQYTFIENRELIVAKK